MSGPSPSLQPRGLRIEQAAQYTGLSPFYIEEQIRAGNLVSIGGPGSGVCRAHIILREHLDKFLDDLAEAAEERRAKAQKKGGYRKAGGQRGLLESARPVV